MDRVLVYDRLDNPVTELAPGDVFGRVRTEEINGIHSLEITTTRVLAKNQRVLTCDAMGKWREYVVEGVDALHEAGERPIGTYYCEWSMQHDLTLTRVSRMPGVQNPVPASEACEAALSGTNRWSVGTVTCLTSAGSSMYDMSGWEAMSVLVQVWGCEVEPEIGVDESGVVSRRVAVLSHVGSETAMRRFDYGSDLVSIVRSVSEEPVYARISPRGAGEEVGDGYGRRITIESVNGGVDWLQNDETADLLKVPDGAGGWEYPVGIVENPDIDDPQKLKDWGLSVLEDYTTPKVTYKAAVLQYQKAGMDIKGISLGDDVQCVDRRFYEDGLRISGRVVALVVNELDETDAQVTIGNAQESAASALAQMAATLGMTEAAVRAMNGGTLSTAAYLSRLLDRLNAEINATGGYTYITEGQGVRTYDRAVSDPLVGAEANAVVEIKGGTIRIANSKTAQGEWQWKTVFTSGHIASDMVTAAAITAGYIGGASGNNFWNLDNGNFSLKDGTSGYGITKTNGTLTIDGSVINVQRLYPREIIAPDKSYGLAFRSPTTYSQSGDSLILLADPTGSNPKKLAHFDVRSTENPGEYESALRLWDTVGDTISLMVHPSNGGTSGAVFTDKSGNYVMIDVAGVPYMSFHSASGAWANMCVLNGKFYITARNSDSTHYSQITFNPGSNPTLSSG